MIKRLLFLLYLYFNGIRFYRTNETSRLQHFRTAKFETVGNHTVEFKFYKEECEDLVYRFGRIKSEKFIGYVIHARLDDDLPHLLLRYNNLKFFFGNRNWNRWDDNTICDMLLNIFLDFINNELKNS